MTYSRSIAVAASAVSVSGLAAGVLLLRPAGSVEHKTELRPAAAAAVTITYPGADVVLGPAPVGSSPGVSPAAALNTYTSSGLFPGVAGQSPYPVDIQLHDFSDNTQGDIQPDGSVLLKYQHVLAYSVIFHAVPYSGVSAGAAAGSPAPVAEDMVVIVDANTGKLLEGFADTTDQ
jgi:hypothetical protein